ncbi:enoyl-CoA hydratase [Undibacterium sp. CY7W]|uniref:Enoyl-CoA hydratase n=1 Tax=Undibacterium rugosum TaxID=2762291 RepID=A0A923I636_9BURK|nr:enoyl-CoA hydratase [Undibacterium rugosum]MBC3936266.1 enoyl-CoA hydratase [Undibacterium rugosum]
MNHYHNLQVQLEQHTALISLHNPPANTFTREGLMALTQLVHDLNARPEITSLILSGSGQKFFSAGADLQAFASGDKALAREMARRFGEAFEALAAFRGVSVAAINGYAMGGGLECALACDIRIAETQAVLALPEATVGLLPCAGGTQHLSWLVGEAWAKRLILLGERIDAATALRIGLVQEVVGSSMALERAQQLAALAAKQSPRSLRTCKQLIQGARSQPVQHMLVQEREAFVDLFDGPDQTEGVQAFLEKRQPNWSYQ